MQAFIQNNTSNEANKRFLARLYNSKEEFLKAYRRFYHEKAKAKELYILMLTKLQKAVLDGNIDTFKRFGRLIDYTNDIEDLNFLRNSYDNATNPIRSTNLVILACKHNKIKIIEYLLGGDGRILYNLSRGIRRAIILPDDEDEAHHNAFYYAIRSGNIELLDTLINKSTNTYFVVSLKRLDKVLSRAYENLKLQNVPLPNETEQFVVNKLIALRFFSNTSKQDQSFRGNRRVNIKKRIDLILENINLLKTEYSQSEEVDERFLFVAKFIAQIISTLKRQLKSTYDRLPWEEIEFCLVIFVSSYTKRQEINLVYKATLNKTKILNHLENFVIKLEDVKRIIEFQDICNLFVLPRLTRAEVITKIISSFPQFEELYKDYQQIRDIYSLEKINKYMKLASLVDPTKREGQLIITRALQVTGEHLKNTLESPKCSSFMSEYFLQLLSRNAKTIIVKVRNSLSHSDSLSKRIEIEDNSDVQFFINIQNDTKKIGGAIIDILYNNKIKIIRRLLEKMVNCKSTDQIKEVIELFGAVELEKIILGNFKLLEHENLENCFKEFSANIINKTDCEKQWLDDISSIINAATQSKNIRTSYITGLTSLKNLSMYFNTIGGNEIDHNATIIKFHASKILEMITSNIVPQNLKAISNILGHILESVSSRIKLDQIHKLNKLYVQMTIITHFVTHELNWINELQIKLIDQNYEKPHIKKQNYNNQLASRLEELKKVLKKNSLNGQLLHVFKNNKKLQAVVEMLLLDILSILGDAKHYLENNVLALDDYTPLLVGKCLRNYLAHDNGFVDVLQSDPEVVVLLNAIMFTDEKLMIEIEKKKIGKLVSDDPFKLRKKHHQCLGNISEQNKLLVALEKGNLEIIKNCIKNGIDINSRSINFWTTLHFAAKGPSLDVVKFILDQGLSVDVRDVDGQSPLHVAAAYGNTNIVEFLLNETHLNKDDLNRKDKTPLHFAAQNGHKDTVDILLKNKAYTFIQDAYGFSPVHYAIKNKHIAIAKTLLEKDVNVDSNGTTIGSTPLYIAAEFGNIEIVNFLIQNKADVNAKNNQNTSPLSAAAMNGHLEVVKALMLNGADVHVGITDGLTLLFVAAETGNVKIANILLERRADVNVSSTIQNNTSLHYGAAFGHVGIVNTILNKNSNASVVNADGLTPLHFAALNGHLDIVDALLKRCVDIDPKDQFNATPLYYAAECGHTKVLKLLIQNNADINVRDINNITPLHAATRQGRKHSIDLLLKNKAEVNAQCNLGLTPLCVAIIKGYDDIVDLLIKHKANVNLSGAETMTDIITKVEINARERESLLVPVVADNTKIVETLPKNNGRVNVKDFKCLTPLHLAALYGHKKIVETCIREKADVNAVTISNITPLFMAAQNGDKELAEILIANGANVHTKSNKDFTSLHVAANYGHSDIVKILLNNKAAFDPKNKLNSTPTMLAVSYGHIQVVEMLLNLKPITKLNGYTLLHVASQVSSNLDMVKYLVDKGFDINAKTSIGLKPIHIAAIKRHKNTVEFFINKKIDINDSDGNRKTLLHYAAENGHLELVKYLIKHGCDVNAKESKGLTPIHIAAEFDYKEVIEILLEYGAVYNVVDESQREPLEVAKNKNIINLLAATKKLFEAVNSKNLLEIENSIKAGAFVSARNADGVTPLHNAACRGYDKVVKVLLKNKANPNVVDNKKMTPLHYAAKFSHLKVVTALLSNYAVYNVVSKEGKTPSDLTVDKRIVRLFKLVNKSFKNVSKDNSQIILIAFTLHMQGNNDEAFRICEEVYQKQYQILGPNYIDTLNTQLVVTPMLIRLKKFEKALNMNREILENRKDILDGNNLAKHAQCNIALILDSQNNNKEALKIYKKFFRNNKANLGIDNIKTLETLDKIAGCIIKQKKYRKGLQKYQKLLNIQETVE